ncbi:MAG: hypothetical protein BWK76_22435 [Desulfobulbaceae bacterium A2]|nr:MAG: hypothetical protein BWK76_22435 [Desulfobulbaceae bacterium A2]
MSWKYFVVVCLGVLLAWNAPAVAAEEGPVTAQLRPVVDRIIAVVTDPSMQGLGKRQLRRERVMIIAHERFDFEEMSRRVLGTAWRDRSPEERRHFVARFTQLLEHAYIGRLEAYSGQAVEYQRERVKDDRAELQTLVREQGKEIPMNYILRRLGDQWMIYDVIIEGVSLVRNYMEQFQGILQKEGYAALLQQLEERIKTLEKESTAVEKKKA